jgi:alpha-N-acetylglucosamine transferase
LDSDLFITAPIDDLFNRPHMSAVIDSMFLHNTNFDLCVEGDEYFKYFNSGVLVIEPNESIFQECLDFLTFLPEDRIWGDQNLLAKVFCNWKD